MFVREIELKKEDVEDDLILAIDQKPEGDTGVVVWDAAIVLSKYLETIQKQIEDKFAVGDNFNSLSSLITICNCLL